MPTNRPTNRTARLGFVSGHIAHPDTAPADDCMVEVIALAVSGGARSVVRCLFANEVVRVPTMSLRPLVGGDEV